MRDHPLHTTDDGMEKAGGAILPLLGTLALIAGSVGTGAWVYNQIRRAWRGPEYENHIKVYPVYGMPQTSQGWGMSGTPFNAGYAVPGALAGAALGGLIGKNWSGAALGGLLGGGLGYLAGNMNFKGMGNTGTVGSPTGIGG